MHQGIFHVSSKLPELMGYTVKANPVKWRSQRRFRERREIVLKNETWFWFRFTLPYRWNLRLNLESAFRHLFTEMDCYGRSTKEVYQDVHLRLWSPFISGRTTWVITRHSCKTFRAQKIKMYSETSLWSLTVGMAKSTVPCKKGRMPSD